jgi:predicted DNA-binding protein with PD1-like motif
MRHFNEPTEINSVNGIIAAGEPHLHVILSNDSGAVAGHLEKNCRVLSHEELTVARFSGPQLKREKSVLKPAQ